MISFHACWRFTENFCYFEERRRLDWAEQNLLDSSANKEATNVALRNSAAVLPSSIVILGFNLLLTAGVECVKDAHGNERERKTERGALSPTFPGALNLWKQVYFCCISESQDVSAAFEVHIPVSILNFSLLLHIKSCILTNRSRQKLHIFALLSSR